MSLEPTAIITLLIAAIGGTAWIVTAIYSVRDEVKDMRVAMMEEVQSLRSEHNVLKRTVEDHLHEHTNHKG